MSAKLTPTEARLHQAGLRRSKAETERHAAHRELAQAVERADKAKMPVGEIAKWANVSRQTVWNILNR